MICLPFNTYFWDLFRSAPHFTKDHSQALYLIKSIYLFTEGVSKDRLKRFWALGFFGLSTLKQ